MDCRRGRRVGGFTLVELLVVIGIIAVLIGVLLPVLSRAREAANTVKCASNLRSVGQGIANYAANYNGVLPASNLWRGMVIGATTQTPTQPSYGTIHWSSYLYGGPAAKDRTDDIYRSLFGWDTFQCPSLDGGGLPPANTFPGNSELQNETQGNDPATNKPVVDAQAPRLAYTLNEALCPRGYFVKGSTMSEGMVERAYRFVKAGSVRRSSDTILGCELWGIQKLMEVPSLNGGGEFVSGARRPVSGFFQGGVIPPDLLWQMPEVSGPFSYLYAFNQVTVGMLSPDPQKNADVGSTPSTTLDWVGRNHGKYALTAGFDARKTNFLYLDGHVETKGIRETLTPTFQWGEKFYSLAGGENVVIP